MKTAVSILVLCAFVAFVHSTPIPQDAEPAAPSRPFLDAISAPFNTASIAFSGIANTGREVAKNVAENTGKFIDTGAENLSQRITSLAHSFNTGINRPFQAAAEPEQEPEQELEQGEEQK